MSSLAIIGAQWGDEGKGKIVDVVAGIVGRVAAFVRFQGGDNAGHTIYVDGEKIVLHNCPSGIVRPGTMNVVGPYVVCNLDVIRKEMVIAGRFGAEVLLDPWAPIVLPIHRLIDQGREARLAGAQVGTTGRGIGPCYGDHTMRRGLTLGDLCDAGRLRRKLSDGDYYAELVAVCRHLSFTPPTLDETVEWCSSFAGEIVPRLGDTGQYVFEADMDPRKTVLFEGAQGMMLDVVSGNRPFCTSSQCGVSAIVASFGIRPRRVIGIAKAYATRVGSGPFPTELDAEASETLRQKGGEFGATTGRPRRVGWFDLMAASYACRMGGITELIFNKLDILSGYETLGLGLGYRVGDGIVAPTATLTTELLERVEPIYGSHPGWSEDISACRRREDLPDNARTFVEKFEMHLNIPVIGIGVGPNRDDMIWSESASSN